MVEPIIVVVLWIYLLVQTLLFIYFLTDEFKKTKPNSALTNYPNVSVLIAARNEETTIANCLNSLLQLNYPKDKLEILVGNDLSTDKTEEILKKFTQDSRQIKYFNITETIGSAKAKANVLAQLIQQSKSDFIFVTDADMEVNKNWVVNLLPFLEPQNYSIVSGTTIVKGKTLLQKMQELEWLLASGQIIGFDRFGIKTTAVGNNMAFTKQAYLKTGGYENIPYSVTEDFQLYKYILNQNFKTINLLNTGVLNYTKAQTSLVNFLHQRKRWLQGAQGLGLGFKAIMALSGLFFPLIVYLCFVNIFLAAIIWVVKLLVQTTMFIVLHMRLNQKLNFLHLILFEIYINIATIMMVIFYVLPIKMVWKNR